MANYCPSHDWDRYCAQFDEELNCQACGADEKHLIDCDECGETTLCTQCHTCYNCNQGQHTVLPEDYWVRMCGECGERMDYKPNRAYVSDFHCGEAIIVHDKCLEAAKARQKQAEIEYDKMTKIQSQLYLSDFFL